MVLNLVREQNWYKRNEIIKISTKLKCKSEIDFEYAIEAARLLCVRYRRHRRESRHSTHTHRHTHTHTYELIHIFFFVVVVALVAVVVVALCSTKKSRFVECFGRKLATHFDVPKWPFASPKFKQKICMIYDNPNP